MVSKIFNLKRITEGSLQCGSLRGTLSRGFTLVEMMVCIAIIGFLATVLLGSRDKYGEQLILRNQAYKVATYVRQAQVYSLGVKGVSSGGSTTFDKSYAVLFDMNSPTRITFFVDENKDGQFQTGEQSEVVPLATGVTLQKICSWLSVGQPEKCSDSDTAVNKIVATFIRPSSVLNSKVFNSSGNPVPSFSPPIKIYLVSKSGTTISVKVEASGSVSIQ
jgi:prepilin-type N-terminal cleavage/methylation domain-containing protein